MKATWIEAAIKRHDDALTDGKHRRQSNQNVSVDDFYAKMVWRHLACVMPLGQG